jgi:hypothetical protein
MGQVAGEGRPGSYNPRVPASPLFVSLGAGLPQGSWGLSRQVGLVLGIGLLVLVAALAIVLTVLLRGPGPAPAASKAPPSTQMEGTLTILPGRFLVEEGDADVELRLVRTSSSEREETTIGRDPGPLYRHVQLRAPSVSARHAKLVSDKGGYTIVNYSRTNPTRVNGDSLSENASRRLVDRDRIEIGEVAITYRET